MGIKPKVGDLVLACGDADRFGNIQRIGIIQKIFKREIQNSDLIEHIMLISVKWFNYNQSWISSYDYKNIEEYVSLKIISSTHIRSSGKLKGQ